jgi:hypothetical protein
MPDLINGPLRKKGHRLDPGPNQQSTADVVTNNSFLSTLAIFKTNQLFGSIVEQFDFLAKVAHILDYLHIILLHLVHDDVICALGRQHNPKKFHSMSTRKSFDFDKFALLFSIFVHARLSTHRYGSVLPELSTW